MSSFTDALLQRHSATQHPFLTQAGDGTLHPDILTKWCRQDYLYAFVGYIKFASTLLSRLPLPTSPPRPDASSKSTALYSAISLLSFSLANIKRETDFFLQTAAGHGLELHPGGVMPLIKPVPRGEYEEITRSYVDFLYDAAAKASIEEGLVLLWAMEKAYFEAWTYAKSHQPAGGFAEPTEAQKALEKFIDNWTCEEFVGFVKHCEEVVNGLEIEQDNDLSAKCEQIFERVLYLEQRFWPNVDVEEA